MKIQEFIEARAGKLDELGLEKGPIITLNLLQFRAKADYSNHPDQPACSGRDAHLRYLSLIYPIAQQLGIKILFRSAILQTLVGPEEEKWDAMGMVEWPTVGMIKKFLNSEEYKAVAFHREAALQDARILICQKDPGAEELL